MTDRPSIPAAIATVLLASAAFAQTSYQPAPEAIRKVLDAAPPPTVTVNPAKTHVLLAQGILYPSIAEVARPRLGLAGVRLDPSSNGPHLPGRYVSFTLKTLPG